MITHPEQLRPWIRAQPEWWLVSLCCAVEVFARCDVSWRLAQIIGDVLTARTIGEPAS